MRVRATVQTYPPAWILHARWEPRFYNGAKMEG